MIDLPIEAERVALVAEAMRWRGTPFHHAARIRGAGVDCAQLLIGVFAECGYIEPPILGHYPADWFLHSDQNLLLPIVEQFCAPVDRPMIGDIALFRYGRAISHGAIVVALRSVEDGPLVIHSFRGCGVLLESVGPTHTLAAHLAGYWRLRRWIGA